MKWDGTTVTCFGSELCVQCFNQGQLRPFTCPRHLTCDHQLRQPTCNACVAKSLKGNWKDWIACYKGAKDPFLIRRWSHKELQFQCVHCNHPFEAQPYKIDEGHFCGFCANRRHCQIGCDFCFSGSIASHPHGKQWEYTLNPGITPEQVAKNDHRKYWFRCAECNHPFQIAPYHVNRGNWCPFCANHQRCSLECNFCFLHSAASNQHTNEWHPSFNNGITPRQVAKNDNRKYWYQCATCEHPFQISPNDVNQGSFCPFCSNTRRCNVSECALCYSHSIVSHPNGIHWDYTLNHDINPRQVARNDHNKYWFQCPTCHHPFEMAPCVINSGFFCPFCSNHQRCGIDECKTCAKVCDICHVFTQQYITRLSKRHCCEQCYKLAIIQDVRDAPLKIRASISMERHFLQALQSRSHDFPLDKPTAWNTAVLPGLPFRPDFMLAFDCNGKIIQTMPSTKLKITEIDYVLHVEVMEISRAQHTAHRDPPDEIREAQIRELFNRHNINIGVVWVTVAHNKHMYSSPHEDDIFFEHNAEICEYFIPDHRKEAFHARVDEVRDALKLLYVEKSNRIILIGH